jgi:hypothetical protein
MSKRALHTKFCMNPDPAHGCEALSSTTIEANNPKAGIVPLHSERTPKNHPCLVASYPHKMASRKCTRTPVIKIPRIAFMRKSELEGADVSDIAFKYHPITYVKMARGVQHSVQPIDSGTSKVRFGR